MTINADKKTPIEERVEIKLPSAREQEWSTLAFLALKKKYTKIGQVIEEAFGIQFETPTSTNCVMNPIRSIAFEGDPAVQAKVETVLNVLLEDINRPPEARRHLNRAAVTEIVTQVNETGTYVPKVFVPVIANGNAPATAGTKREATQAQIDFEDQIRKNDMSFGMGPAGTGKTYVAMKLGVEALKTNKVKKLLLARPATEAGENIGFLPGTQEDKLAPYMRPLYDELDKAFGRSAWKKMMESGQIEVVPVGFMRGRTFDDAFIVIDEAQNLTQEQLDMAATRIGYNSKMVITGDPNQIDLKPKSLSALVDFVEILRGEPGVGIQHFAGADCVRSRMAQTIVDAIERKRAKLMESKLAASLNEAATPTAKAKKETEAAAPAKVKKQSRLLTEFAGKAPKAAKAAPKAAKAAPSALEKAVAAPKIKGDTARKPAAMTAPKKKNEPK